MMREQARITQRVTDKETEDVMVLTCIYGCVDEEGMPIFTLKDKDALRKKNGKVIKRFFEEIVRLSGTNVEEAPKKLSRLRKFSSVKCDTPYPEDAKNINLN